MGDGANKLAIGGGSHRQDQGDKKSTRSLER